MGRFCLSGLIAKDVLSKFNEVKRMPKRIRKEKNVIEKIASEPITFNDVFRNEIKYWVCMQDYHNKPLPIFTDKPCWFCRKPINGAPLGCPISYIKPTNKEELIQYFQRENIPFDKEDLGYFVTEGLFHSFPCIKSYIREQLMLGKIQFKSAYTLLTLLYCKIFGKIENIPFAPSWKLKESAMGVYSDEEYDKLLGKFDYFELPQSSRPLMFPAGSSFVERKL